MWCNPTKHYLIAILGFFFLTKTDKNYSLQALTIVSDYQITQPSHDFVQVLLWPLKVLMFETCLIQQIGMFAFCRLYPFSTLNTWSCQRMLWFLWERSRLLILLVHVFDSFRAIGFSMKFWHNSNFSLHDSDTYRVLYTENAKSIGWNLKFIHSFLQVLCELDRELDELEVHCSFSVELFVAVIWLLGLPRCLDFSSVTS